VGWRHHGPKVEAQLELLTQQVLNAAGGKPMAALRDLAQA
jgi:hypothetical protein